MTKLFPHIFTSTNNSTQKKSTKISGQPFPFQSLNGGITKEEAYSVSYHDTHAKASNKRDASRIESRTGSRGSIEELGNDAISAEGSFEWIVMQDNAKGSSSQK